MKERPILFSGPMVCAILEGRKTQTRRVVKFQRGFNEKGNVRVSGDMWQVSAGQYNVWSDPFSCPYGVAGDRLWVRETWSPSVKAPLCQVAYAADGRCYGIGGNGCGNNFHIFHGWLVDSAVRGDKPGDTFGRSLYEKWRPSIHMPRWASRLTLEITDVRVERLQSISEDDAKAEGVDEMCVLPGDQGSFIQPYAALWESINGPGSWNANPWVWVVEFKQI